MGEVREDEKKQESENRELVWNHMIFVWQRVWWLFHILSREGCAEHPDERPN